MPEQKEWLDVRNFLRWVNGIVALLILLTYPIFQDARYVNGFTFLAALVLALQVHWGLSTRKPVADPFVVILLYYVTIYYTLRVVTLAVFDISDVLGRFPYGPQDTNYALAFIVACNACMLYGFGLMRRNISLPSYALMGGEANTRNVETFLRPLLVVLFISVIGAVSGLFDWLSEQFRILRVLIFFLRPTTLLLLVGVYLVIFYREIPRRYVVVYIFLHLLVGFSLIMGGSRGQIVYLFEMFALVLIANEVFRIRWKWVFQGLMAAPLLLAVLVVTFNFATLQRSSDGRDEGRLEVVMNNLYGAIANGDGMFDFNNVSRIFSRVGYLDISSEIIANESKYKSIFSASYYAKSFVDNLLTPGFDYYDTPKIAYALIFKHQNLNQGTPSKSYLLDNNIYHSDQLGFYGEMYSLFGWYSLLFLFLFAYTLKWVYYNFCVSRHGYEIVVVKRVLVLAFYVNFINSFGFDWIVTQTLPLIFTAGLLIIFFMKVVPQKSREAIV